MQHEATQHIKPKQKHRRRMLPNGRPVFVIVTAVIIILLGWQVISAFSVTTETTPAVQVTVNEYLSRWLVFSGRNGNYRQHR